MATRITRIGNTLSVEIPEELIARSALPLDKPVEWVPNAEGGLSLVPQSNDSSVHPKHRSLSDLLDAIPGAEPTGECDWGPQRGHEAW